MNGSDQPTNGPEMAKKYRKIHVFYQPLEDEFLRINQTLDTVMLEVQRVAATHAEIPLALMLNEPDEHEFSTGRVVHSSLLLLDKTKDKISNDQWKQYNEAYEKLIATHGGHTTSAPGVTRFTHFNAEMDTLLTSIGDYIEVNHIPAKRAFWGGEPSPRCLAAIAILHAAAWLQQQAEKSKTES